MDKISKYFLLILSGALFCSGSSALARGESAPQRPSVNKSSSISAARDAASISAARSAAVDGSASGVSREEFGGVVRVDSSLIRGSGGEVVAEDVNIDDAGQIYLGGLEPVSMNNTKVSYMDSDIVSLLNESID